MNHSANNPLPHVYTLLRTIFGLVPVVAGLDKFFNLLTDWSQYLPSFAVKLLPFSAGAFMGIVGVIEIVAGLAVLTKLPRLGAWIVAFWLCGVAVAAALAGFLDVAVRDLVMAAAAYTLAQLASLREEPLLPR